MVEQPASSRLVWYPRWEALVAKLNMFRVGWWARHYGALSPQLGCTYTLTCSFFSVPGDFRFRETILSLVRKRHRGWSNSSAIGALDRGFLRKKARDSCVVKTTTKKKRADGKRTYSGNRWLKGTQPGPHQESFFADLRACRMQKVFSLHQLKKVQVISSGLRTQSSAHTAQALGQMQWASSFAF